MQERVPKTINTASQAVPPPAWRHWRGGRIVVPGRLLDASISDQSVRTFVAVAELDYTADGCYMAVTNLAERLSVDRGTIHRALAELESLGFIYRTRTLDGRDAWKVRPFAMSAHAGGYALIWPKAVRRIVSARHFRAYAVCVREDGRPHGRDITAALVASALVNLGPSDGRGRRVPKPVSLDTAQRVLDDLTLSGWVTARRQGRAGLPNLYTPQTSGGEDVTREWCAGVRRMTTLERRAALNAAELAPHDDEGQADGQADEQPDTRGDEGERADEPGTEPSVQDAPDLGTRQGEAERPADPPGDIHSPPPASPEPDGPPASSQMAKEEDPQVSEESAPDDIHNDPQRRNTMTGQSPPDVSQRYDSHCPQQDDDPSRNGAALEELAQGASSEHVTQIPVVRNGPVADACARDDLFGDDGEASGDAAVPDPAAAPSSGNGDETAADPDTGPPADPASDRAGDAGARYGPHGGLDVDGVPLRERLENARQAGRETGPARPGSTRRPAVTVAQLRRRLEGIEAAHRPPRPPGPPPPPARRGRRPA